jgi:hypothetical protein
MMVMRLPRCSDVRSLSIERRVGPGISPGPLTGPCVSLSTHTARATGELRGSPPLVDASVLSASGSSPFSLASPTRFSSSVRKPGLESRLLYTGHRLASKQVSARLFPELGANSGFRCRLWCFDASSEVHLRSSLQSLHDGINVPPLAMTFTTAAFAEAAHGSLKPPPTGRVRRVHLHLSYNMARSRPLDTNSLTTAFPH